MPEFLHRFRSTKFLLEHEELENQEIYFPLPNQLNDPLEGFKDIFWQGDSIVWKNLLKHYLLCLEQVCALLLLSSKNDNIDEAQIPVFKTEKDFPTLKYENIYREICDAFFNMELVNTYLNYLSSQLRPVRRNELTFYLSQLHIQALGVIFAIYENHNLIKKQSGSNLFYQFGLKTSSSTLDKISELDQSDPNIQDAIERIYAILNTFHLQNRLVDKYNNADNLPPQNKVMVFFEFPEKYLIQLEKIIYPGWHTACFVGNCNNPAMWGHYGDNHKGVCLKFKTSLLENKEVIKLHGITGIHASKGESKLIHGERIHIFHQVKYAKKYPEIDFFRSLGTLPSGLIQKAWYLDEQGNKSLCADDMFRNTDSWREKYWNKFYNIITTKLEDWSYEEEYRLIISNSLMGAYYADTKNRKLGYQFKDLEGIIFGIRTSEENKLKIIKIIEAKCQKEKRTDFKFFQSFYDRNAPKIGAFEMTALKFNF